MKALCGSLRSQCLSLLSAVYNFLSHTWGEKSLLDYRKFSCHLQCWRHLKCPGSAVFVVFTSDDDQMYCYLDQLQNITLQKRDGSHWKNDGALGLSSPSCSAFAFRCEPRCQMLIYCLLRAVLGSWSEYWTFESFHTILLPWGRFRKPLGGQDSKLLN